MRSLREVIVVKKEEIFESRKLEKIIKTSLAGKSNVIVFGLPGSGKSTLIKEVCRNSKTFSTLEEEEILDCEDLRKIKKKTRGRQWIVGHQFPASNEMIPDKELVGFCTKKLGLGKEWTILRIKTQ